jgi:plasmid stabilization system protein ParE
VPTPLVPNILSESPCESRRNIFLNIASLVRCIGHFVTVILAVYRIRGDKIEILRILHGAQNWP